MSFSTKAIRRSEICARLSFVVMVWEFFLKKNPIVLGFGFLGGHYRVRRTVSYFIYDLSIVTICEDWITNHESLSHAAWRSADQALGTQIFWLRKKLSCAPPITFKPPQRRRNKGDYFFSWQVRSTVPGSHQESLLISMFCCHSLIIIYPIGS